MYFVGHVNTTRSVWCRGPPVKMSVHYESLNMTGKRTITSWVQFIDTWMTEASTPKGQWSRYELIPLLKLGLAKLQTILDTLFCTFCEEWKSKRFQFLIQLILHYHIMFICYCIVTARPFGAVWHCNDIITKTVCRICTQIVHQNGLILSWNAPDCMLLHPLTYIAAPCPSWFLGRSWACQRAPAQHFPTSVTSRLPTRALTCPQPAIS